MSGRLTTARLIHHRTRGTPGLARGLLCPYVKDGLTERMRVLHKIARLFVIKSRLEAFAIIYALALGATARGAHYLTQYPGWGGKLLFLACTGAVFMAGAKILDCLKFERGAKDAAQPAN